MPSNTLQPVLLCVGGHDPSGGAGILADAEAARASGVLACTVITCLTTQDTCGVKRLCPQRADQVEEQCRSLLADSFAGALKIGLLGSSAMVRVLCNVVTAHPQLPLVLDPVLASGTGQPLADAALLNQMRRNLLGRCSLITPNLQEARTLSGFRDPDDCAQKLLESGCGAVLITSANGSEKEVVNRYFCAHGHNREWSWPRLGGEYHGSGCTLASAIAARIVRGIDIESAIAQAQDYTFKCLQRAVRTGRCQLTPNRFFALDPDLPQGP